MKNHLFNGTRAAPDGSTFGQWTLIILCTVLKHNGQINRMCKGVYVFCMCLDGDLWRLQINIASPAIARGKIKSKPALTSRTHTHTTHGHSYTALPYILRQFPTHSARVCSHFSLRVAAQEQQQQQPQHQAQRSHTVACKWLLVEWGLAGGGARTPVVSH